MDAFSTPRSYMSLNKNALLRYQVLDRCFRNPGREYYIEDLLEECNKALLEFAPQELGIQRRQLYDDMRFMESEQGWSVPLERYRDGHRVYYRYADLSFSINNQSLNDNELEMIRSALQVFSRFSGTPQFEWVAEMIPMFESRFGLIRREKEVISFETNIDLKGLHFLTPIFNAIINQRVLQVTYQDFRSTEPYDIIFHPQYLKQYNNRWFAFGWNGSKSIAYWTLALDRIVALKEMRLAYHDMDTDWEDYFYDMIGVTRPADAEPVEVVLHFSSNVAPYVTTKPLHPSQKHRACANGLEVRIKVILNKELERLILSFGEDVQVVSPQSLRDIVFHRLRDGVRGYEKVAE